MHCDDDRELQALVAREMCAGTRSDLCYRDCPCEPTDVAPVGSDLQDNRKKFRTKHEALLAARAAHLAVLTERAQRKVRLYHPHDARLSLE